MTGMLIYNSNVPSPTYCAPTMSMVYSPDTIGTAIVAVDDWLELQIVLATTLPFASLTEIVTSPMFSLNVNTMSPLLQ